ncbi:hypothetical protein LPJ53_002498 [Coemansia erecta]|uniref:CID domain-containing protein n=1 Tax=Coemansia erecta TaxID=147472 RepID=A0A9W7XY23_9FUNG|nr:hypothetical protein LPJ53_002498 [Coemansia erecta]
MDDTDPFEIRMVFGNQLDNLSGSQLKIEHTSKFALKHASMADSLLEFIIEKLEKPQVPLRINLLFLIDAILQSDNRKGETEWTDLIKKEVVSIVKAVIPESSGGDANVPHVRKMVSGWKRKKIFDTQIIGAIDLLLANRVGGSSGNSDTGMKHQDILKRIEEDRERHKRNKEDFWIRPADEGSEGELDSYWETTSDLNDADWQEITEENEEYRRERQLIEMARDLALSQS